MWLKRALREAELIDGPAESISLDDYRAGFAAVEWTNRHLGGASALIRPLESMSRKRRLGSFTILDVGCGGGDVDDEILRWAVRRNLGITILGIDSHPHAVRVARERLGAHRETAVSQIDFFETKFSNGSFDFVISTMLLHHLPEARIAEFLWRAWRIARAGVIVVDLRRSLPAYMAARWIVPRLAPASAVFAHDAPLSFRRAFTLKEIRELTVKNNLPYLAKIPWRSPFRIVLTAERSEQPPIMTTPG